MCRHFRPCRAHMAGVVQKKNLVTSYSGAKGFVHVWVALYATSHDVEAAFAEPAYGSVQVQSNGARMRRGPGTGATAHSSPARRASDRDRPGPAASSRSRTPSERVRG
jgi:hypothetical protein